MQRRFPKEAMLQPTDVRRREALAALNVDAGNIRTLPPISAQLRMLAKHLRARNLSTSPYFYLKCSESPEARQIVELYYSLPKCKRNLVPIEAYCFAAGIHPLILLKIITAACQQVSAQTSAFLAATSQTEVVGKTIERALDDNNEDNVKYVEMLHKHNGFLPVPKTAQTHINVTQNTQAINSAQSNHVLGPPPESTIRRLVDRFHEARGLPPATAMPALPESVGHTRLPADFTPKDIMVAVPVSGAASNTIEEEEAMDEDT